MLHKLSLSTKLMFVFYSLFLGFISGYMTYFFFHDNQWPNYLDISSFFTMIFCLFMTYEIALIDISTFDINEGLKNLPQVEQVPESNFDKTLEDYWENYYQEDEVYIDQSSCHCKKQEDKDNPTTNCCKDDKVR